MPSVARASSRIALPVVVFTPSIIIVWISAVAALAMLSVSSAAIGYAPVTAPVRQPRADVRMETMSDLDALAQKLNPKVGLYAALADLG